MTKRDADKDSIGVSLAVLDAVGKLAKKQGVRAPNSKQVLNMVWAHLENGSQQSPELIAEEVLADWREIEAGRNSSAGPVIAHTGPGAVTSLVLAVTFKPFVERFRYEVWGNVDPPFTTEGAAGVWVELMHRVELKRNDAYLDSPNTRDFPSFKLYIPNAGWESWGIPVGGILEKLHQLCKALAEVSEWWRVDNALKFVLLGSLPSAIRVQPSGNGNYTRRITITLDGPVTEDELVKAYRRGCETTYITPQSLSRVHFRLLYLVHYLMPEALWPERFRQWLEWCKEDESLPKYGARLREDGSVEKPEGYRNLKREYKRAMDRQSWTEKVPEIFRSKDEFDAWVKSMLPHTSVKRSPPPPWEKPDFDTSGFDYPHGVNMELLDDLCLEAVKIPRHEITTFWQFLTKK